MSIIPYRPFGSLSAWEPIDSLASSFRRDFDRLFATYFTSRAPSTGSWTPVCETTEDDDAFRLRFELPGVDAKDVQVERSGDVLSIRATRAAHRGDGEVTSTFEESLTLPSNVDGDRIVAEMKKGVLTVQLPKNPAAKPKAIPVATTD